MFAWDPNKARANMLKHKVSFHVACGVFFDSNALEIETNEKAGERRFKRLGKGFDARVLLIIYTIRKKSSGEETIRVISARRASKKERKAYAGL